MGKSKTTEEFIRDAKDLHGNKYDYTKVVYINAKTKVTIICPKHGEFVQTPSHHTSSKNGCPTCTNSFTKTTGVFIEESNLIHNSKYDYSKVVYINAKTKVTIICPKHGEFFQKPNNHLMGKGCTPCKYDTNIKKQTKPNEQFIKDAVETHGETYDYSLVEYKNSHSDVRIICKKHGEFKQQAGSHIRGRGCNKCSNNIRSQEDFISDSRSVHGDRYDYSLVNFIDTKTNIKIICKTHGVFEQRPSGHLMGGGCQLCVHLNLRSSLEEFVFKANELHDDRYDYSLVEYTNNRSKVKIGCLKHGVFEQIPTNHLKGHGCPKCKSSKGEIAVNKFLTNQFIDFRTQEKFVNCKYKRLLSYDFYIPKINLLIEFDGDQHYKPISVFGGNVEFAKQKIKDAIKTKYAENNKIGLVRIRDINEIEQILTPYVELYNTGITLGAYEFQKNRLLKELERLGDEYFIYDGQILYDDLY